MRVISQIGHIDVDYESNSFRVRSKVENGDVLYAIETKYEKEHPEELAEYSTKEKALKAFAMMHENYTKYIVIDSHNNMFITNGLDYELDRAFKRIEVKELKATAFKFPADEDL